MFSLYLLGKDYIVKERWSRRKYKDWCVGRGGGGNKIRHFTLVDVGTLRFAGFISVLGHPNSKISYANSVCPYVCTFVGSSLSEVVSMILLKNSI